MKVRTTDSHPKADRSGLPAEPLRTGDPRANSKSRAKPSDLPRLFACLWGDCRLVARHALKECPVCHGPVEEIADRAGFFEAHPGVADSLSPEEVRQVVDGE